MNATGPFPARPQCCIIPLVRNETSNICNAGINLHQYAKYRFGFQLLSPPGMDLSTLFNMGGRSLRIFSTSVNKITNDGEGSVYCSYYN